MIGQGCKGPKKQTLSTLGWPSLPAASRKKVSDREKSKTCRLMLIARAPMKKMKVKQPAPVHNKS